MTQEALLDLIEAYAEARDAAWMQGAVEPGTVSQAWAAVLDAVRSLPIEAGR